MTRPCTCNRFNRDPYAAFTLDQCRLCWLHAHSIEYRELWSAAAVGAGERKTCRHLGADTGITAPCPSCSGTVALKVFNCSVHGHCTLSRAVANVACCATCPDRQE